MAGRAGGAGGRAALRRVAGPLPQALVRPPPCLPPVCPSYASVVGMGTPSLSPRAFPPLTPNIQIRPCIPRPAVPAVCISSSLPPARTRDWTAPRCPNFAARCSHVAPAHKPPAGGDAQMCRAGLESLERVCAQLRSLQPSAPPPPPPPLVSSAADPGSGVGGTF